VAAAKFGIGSPRRWRGHLVAVMTARCDGALTIS
jgi:hypothetical protein